MTNERTRQTLDASKPATMSQSSSLLPPLRDRLDHRRATMVNTVASNTIYQCRTADGNASSSKHFNNSNKPDDTSNDNSNAKASNSTPCSVTTKSPSKLSTPPTSPRCATTDI